MAARINASSTLCSLTKRDSSASVMDVRLCSSLIACSSDGAVVRDTPLAEIPRLSLLKFSNL